MALMKPDTLFEREIHRILVLLEGPEGQVTWWLLLFVGHRTPRTNAAKHQASQVRRETVSAW
jgi:hypothetical protein